MSAIQYRHSRGARRELAADVDFDVVLDMLSGAIWYRLFTAHAPIGPNYARDLVRHIMTGIVAPARRRHPDATQSWAVSRSAI
jgi:hypothetical protein